ncbi:MAG: hypothetical protein WA743_16715, partial [Pseudolabrys sp.]
SMQASLRAADPVTAKTLTAVSLVPAAISPEHSPSAAQGGGLKWRGMEMRRAGDAYYAQSGIYPGVVITISIKR